MVGKIGVYCDLRLKQLAIRAAQKRGLPMSELVVQALVDYLGAPKSLRIVPRKPMGRPPKDSNGHAAN